MGHHSIVLEQRACDDLDVQSGFLASRIAASASVSAAARWPPG
jgi:hypothetical protein